jgi:ribose transport system permease protein
MSDVASKAGTAARVRFLDLLQQYGVIVAFIGLFAFNAIWQGEAFLKPENLRNLLNQNAAVGIVAVGMTLVIVAGGIDLSVGAVMALAAAVGMLAMNGLAGMVADDGAGQFVPMLAGFGAAIGVGLACGLLNGGLVTLGRIPAFIATLAGLIGFRSITLALAEGGEIRANPAITAVQAIGRDGITIPGVVNAYDKPVVFYWTILVFLAVVVIGQLTAGISSRSVRTNWRRGIPACRSPESNSGRTRSSASAQRSAASRARCG